MPSINYTVFLIRVSNLFQYVKWEVFLICALMNHAGAKYMRVPLERGVRDMLPQKI